MGDISNLNEREKMIIRFYKHITNGGDEFVDYNTDEGQMVAGNTASTSVPMDRNGIMVRVATLKELEFVAKQLDFYGVEDRGRQ